MVKIGFDGTRAFAENKTGIGWYCFYLIKSFFRLTKKKKDCQFILYTNKPFPKIKHLLEDIPDNWQVVYLAWPFRFFWTQIRFSLELLFNPIDILFVPGYGLPLICPKSSFFTVHDLGFERFKNFYSLSQRFLLYFTYRRGVKKAKKIIVPSQFTKDELISVYNLNPGNIEVAPLGYDDKIFFYKEGSSLEDEKIVYSYGLEPKKYFLYVGAVNKKKNVDFLVSVYQKFIEKSNLSVKLALVGPDFASLKHKYFGKDNLVKVPYLKREHLSVFYRQALAFIFPSLYEGFGLPLLEAMACGCPVIASSIPPFKEIGQKDIFLYFDPRSEEQLLSCLEKIVQSADLRARMKKKGLKRVKNYSWDNCAFKILKAMGI